MKKLAEDVWAPCGNQFKMDSQGCAEHPHGHGWVRNMIFEKVKHGQVITYEDVLFPAEIARIKQEHEEALREERKQQEVEEQAATENKPIWQVWNERNAREGKGKKVRMVSTAPTLEVNNDPVPAAQAIELPALDRKAATGYDGRKTSKARGKNKAIWEAKRKAQDGDGDNNDPGSDQGAVA